MTLLHRATAKKLNRSANSSTLRQALGRHLAIVAGVSLALLSGCAVIVAPDHDGNMKMRHIGGKTKFECRQSGSGECHYALYTSQCKTSESNSGKPATTCTHQIVEQFKLSEGQTREFSDLPSGYKQCMKTSQAPEVPNCN